MNRTAFLKFITLGSFAFVSASCSSTSSISATTAKSPNAAADSFYRAKLDLKIDGLPSEKQLSKLSPYLTPELHSLFASAQKTQAAESRKNPDEKPPWVEGDLFSSLFEGVSSYRIGQATTNGDHAEVKVNLVYNDAGKPQHWTDTIVLRQMNQHWLVDDIKMQGKWAFKGAPTLRRSLTSKPE